MGGEGPRPGVQLSLLQRPADLRRRVAGEGKAVIGVDDVKRGEGERGGEKYLTHNTYITLKASHIPYHVLDSEIVHIIDIAYIWT